MEKSRRERCRVGRAASLLVLLTSCHGSHAGSTQRAYLSATELERRVRAGKLSSEDLVEDSLDRIAALDREGPSLHSVISLAPGALEEARFLDRVLAESGPIGPLHGLPVLVKDNVDTADGTPTTAGSLALADHFAADDAFLVQALRDAGAIVIGKANLSEWANFRGDRSVSGWSSAGGQTRNPHVLDRSPCGSSSGSGAAVAAGLVPLAVGTETDGSITCPSSACGVVGLKPTLGLVSRDGIVPIAIHQDTAGPMARSVADVALLLGVLDEKDARDPAAGAHPGPRDYTASLREDGLLGLRIGVLRDFDGAGSDPDVESLYDAQLAVLRAGGATLVDPVTLEPDPSHRPDAEMEVLLYEFKDGLERYLATANVDPALDSLSELVVFNAAHADTVLPWFGQETFVAALAKGPLTEAAYLSALQANNEAMRRRIDGTLAKGELDLLIAPTGGPAWPLDYVQGDRFGVSSTTPAAVAGYPALTVPMGFVHDLPVGLTFFGPAWSEPLLIQAGYAFEQATRAWRAPEFRESLER